MKKITIKVSDECPWTEIEEVLQLAKERNEPVVIVTSFGNFEVKPVS